MLHFQHFRPDNVSAGGEIRFLWQILFLKYNKNEKVKTLLLCPYEHWSRFMFVLKGIKTVAWLRTNDKLPSTNLHEFNCTSQFLSIFNDNFHSPPFFWHFLNFSQLTRLTKSISVKKILDSCGEKYQNQDFSHIVLSVSLQRGVKVRSTFFLCSEVKQCSEIITNSLPPFCLHAHATMLKIRDKNV